MYPKTPPAGKDKRTVEVPLAFPQQHQNQMPGEESEMTPRPISENVDYPKGVRLLNKSAVITGGDSGIGRAIAYAFAKEGADVAILYLNEKNDAAETQKHVEELGRKCFPIQADLRQEQPTKQAVEQAVQFLGKLDVLINNCAVQYLQNSIADITEQQLENTFRSNFYSYFFATKAALPYLKEGSCIINTTSITAYAGSPKLLDYSATKGAIVAFTRSLSLSLADKGIRVNAVAPGPTWTPLIPSSFPSAEVETFGGEVEKAIPLKRAGQPFEVAGSFVFLASDESKYMSGQVLHPNGGQIVES
jgi:NAD(P)-dependent dehydrogenase (short-subunit alcohol dehydrogenase family)